MPNPLGSEKLPDDELVKMDTEERRVYCKNRLIFLRTALEDAKRNYEAQFVDMGEDIWIPVYQAYVLWSGAAKIEFDRAEKLVEELKAEIWIFEARLANLPPPTL